MIKTKVAVAGILLSVACGPAMLYAADKDADRSSAKAYVKDSVITTKVKAKLAEEKVASLVNIRVDTDNQGVVYLSGTAKTQSDIDKAVGITRGVEGVVSVDNKIKIKS